MESAPGIVQNGKCLLTELADGTGVLLHRETKFYYSLNPTGVEVWKALGTGANSERSVAEKISKEFEADLETALVDVRGVLEMMRSAGLVRNVR